MPSAEPLPHFVDDYLNYLHESEPTNATLDGVHAHDDLLEDLGRTAVEGRIRALAGFARRLDEIDGGGLTPVEQAERPMLAANIRGRMFELEEVRTWEKNPQFYADIVASSLAGQALFTHAPAPDRARRVHVYVERRRGPKPPRPPSGAGRIDPARARGAHAGGPGLDKWGGGRPEDQLVVRATMDPASGGTGRDTPRRNAPARGCNVTVVSAPFPDTAPRRRFG